MAVSAPFAWATGIEDTFIVAPWRQSGRRLDEYELTNHYELWRSDLDLVAALGVSHCRYGIPWHRISPAPGRWDWQWTDRALNYILARGVVPIVDLVHYGTPIWLEQAFLHPDYPQRVAEYAAAVADRYRGRIRYYTPLNEPRIAAWYCGMLGWWPPYRRGWDGFLTVLLALCRGIVRTDEALRAVDAGNVAVHVDATDLYTTSDPEFADEVARRQHIVFLALDLISSRVDPNHPLAAWLARRGVAPEKLEWFAQHNARLDVIGINLYPMFTYKEIGRGPSGRRIRMRYASGAMVEQLGRLYWERFGRPMIIAETAALGSVKRRCAWLEDSVDGVRALRADGIPLIGYTWWPLFSLVAWSYRQSARELERYWLKMGLWDVDPDPASGLRRMRTAVADRYCEIVAAGDRTVGPLRNEPATA